MKNIPDDIHRFLLANIESVEQLEVLLLLWRGADTDWTAEAVARALYSQPSSVARRLATLHHKGLLAQTDGRYRYAPKTDALGETVTRLADLYRERRVAVITVIASKPMENVRAFSDAFRLRKRHEEE